MLYIVSSSCNPTIIIIPMLWPLRVYCENVIILSVSPSWLLLILFYWSRCDSDFSNSKLFSLCFSKPRSLFLEMYYLYLWISLQAIPLLVGWPACLRNFLNFFCEMSCSPNQSLFINVTSTKKVRNQRSICNQILYEFQMHVLNELFCKTFWCQSLWTGRCNWLKFC